MRKGDPDEMLTAEVAPTDDGWVFEQKDDMPNELVLHERDYYVSVWWDCDHWAWGVWPEWDLKNGEFGEAETMRQAMADGVQERNDAISEADPVRAYRLGWDLIRMSGK